MCLLCSSFRENIIHHPKCTMCTSQNNLSGLNGNMIWVGIRWLFLNLWEWWSKTCHNTENTAQTVWRGKKGSKSIMPWCFNQMPSTWRRKAVGLFWVLSLFERTSWWHFHSPLSARILCLAIEVSFLCDDDRPIVCWCFEWKCSEFILRSCCCSRRRYG